jgi:hypothetical protein
MIMGEKSKEFGGKCLFQCQFVHFEFHMKSDSIRLRGEKPAQIK